MEISFKTQGDIQIIEIDGAMGDAEAAAIRVKLEQKINQGRAKVLFELGNFPLEDNASRKLLQGIIAYSLNRGALAACCGVKPSHRPLLLLPGDKQAKIFFTRTEGIDFLTKNAPANPKANMGAKPKTEEDLKEEAIQKLLDRYEAFQHSDDDDPFRLEFLIEQYKAASNREALVIERKAQKAIADKLVEIEAMEKECDKLAIQVKALMQYRKIPLSGQEARIKQESLTRELEEMKKATGLLKAGIHENKTATEKAIASLADEKKASAEAILSLEENLKLTGEAQSKEAVELQAQDTLEQTNFDAKMKS